MRVCVTFLKLQEPVGYTKQKNKAYSYTTSL